MEIKNNFYMNLVNQDKVKKRNYKTKTLKSPFYHRILKFK